MGISIFSDIDKVKSTVGFVLGTIMAVVGFVFKCIAWYDQMRSRRIKLRREEIDLKEFERFKHLSRAAGEEED